MPHDPDPDSLRLHFGLELRRLRTRADLSMSKLAKALGCTPQWISQLEQSDKPVPEQSAYDLDTYFRTEGWEENDGMFHRIYAAIRRAGQRRVLLPGFEAYLPHEAKAIGIRCLAAHVVPGLLQIEEYAQGLMDPTAPEETLTARVAGRLQRQAIFTRGKPPASMFVLDESVFHRPVGGNKVMVDQIDHLIGMAQSRPQLRVLPFGRVTPVALAGGFVLLSFEKDPDLLFFEIGSACQLLQERDVVFTAGVHFDTVMGEALSQTESIEFMKRVREEYL